MTTAQELRQLAQDLENVVNRSPVMSVVGKYCQTLTDHIQAIARIHELNEEKAAKVRNDKV